MSVDRSDNGNRNRQPKRRRVITSFETEAVNYLPELPEGCIAQIVSLTSPRDACRLCFVSRVFRSAAESNTVWDRFLRLEYPYLVPPHYRPGSYTKHLFLSVPILIDQGRMSFSLDKVSGKICYMISARALSIFWSYDTRFWRWIRLHGARFDEVAELINICWFEIRGKIDIQMLSPLTSYTLNLVFRSSPGGTFGFENQRVDAWVGLAGGATTRRSVYLDSANQIVENHPREREDGWLETELGEFSNGRQNGELEFRVCVANGGKLKGGLIVQGIEIRPKQD